MNAKAAWCIVGLVTLVAGSGCKIPEPRISDLAPYVGRRPEAPTPSLPPMPEQKPVEQTHPKLIRATVVIDAGHGGEDPGAIGVGPIPEKEVNLCVATRLARRLAQRGITVVTSRDADYFIELDARAALADRTRADLFVSIHADAAQRTSATGSSIFIARGRPPQSDRAAWSIFDALQRANIECLGVREAGFRVLVGHSRPAVLIECGYLTNSRDAQRLSTSTYQEKLATAIAEGIIAYLAGR
ncbi:MAG: N-acetylmuramoyl-L-alanine amidase [Planctomycetota bacterium]